MVGWLYKNVRDHGLLAAKTFKISLTIMLKQSQNMKIGAESKRFKTYYLELFIY